MKKFLLMLLFVSCQQEDKKLGACVTYFTSATKVNCSNALQNISRKQWCQNVKSINDCQDVESCFVDNYALYNRFFGVDSSCASEAYLFGCGDGVFSIDNDNCP
jgi:hypothetical protein